MQLFHVPLIRKKTWLQKQTMFPADLKNYKPLIIVLMGLAFGFLINLRIMGILLSPLVVALMIIDILLKREDRSFTTRGLKLMFILLVSTVGMFYLSWPICESD